jgi:hypothetical protein
MLTRNIGNKERTARILGGGLMTLCAIAGLGITASGLAIACVGLITIITGIARYCPACALAGRKSVGCDT